jgi:hypothetical protein
MDVRFISEEGIQQHPVEDLTALLARDDGLVWVDIPVCNEDAARVLSEVLGLPITSRFPTVSCVTSGAFLAGQVWCTVQLVISGRAAWRRVE